MSTRKPLDSGTLQPVDNESRGEAIKRRRLALGIDSYRRFAEATGRDRGTLTAAEEGSPSTTTATLDWLEAWLTRAEAEAGLGEPSAAAPSGPIKLTLHGVYGVDEIIVEGPVDRPDELAEAVGKILDRMKARDEGDG